MTNWADEVQGDVAGAGDADVPARSIRYEVFGPDLWLAHAEG
ncbi:hypothetical protein [Streptomyces achromogenes]